MKPTQLTLKCSNVSPTKRRCFMRYYTGWAKKVSRKLLSISSPNSDRFSKFFTGTFCEKFVICL